MPDSQDLPGTGSPAVVAVDAGGGLGSPTDAGLPRPVVSEGLEVPDIVVQADNDAAQEDATEAASSDSQDAFADDGSSIYGGEDDAQSFIQPAISPIASRLSSPRTPAIEKAMAMDKAANGTNGGGGFFDAYRPAIASRLQSSTPAQSSVPAAAPATSAGPLSKPSAMSSVFQSGGARHNRSLSVGSDALKRLSKALPSISFPSASSFLPNLGSTHFFSSNNSGTSNFSLSPSSPSATLKKRSPYSSPTRALHQNTQPSPQQPRLRRSIAPDPNTHPRRHTAGVSAAPRTLPPAASPPQRPPSITSGRPHILHRSTSDDSLLYQTLSRVPSHGDEGQFDHVREQVNSRVKAIMDSFDRPTFKMPQLPSFFPDAKASPAPAPREALSPLDSALESLTGDVVILGGYRGSILRSAEPPHRQLWVPVKVGLNIRKVNMEVGLDDQDEEDMPNHIFPSGMLKHIGPVDISRRLFKKMRECENARKGLLRVHDFGYDWRLSPHRLSNQLVEFLKKLPCNQTNPPGGQWGAVVISHSLGGLITRHAVNQRPDLFAGVIFAGTPQRCINILGPLRNGDAVLLNEKVLTARVHFSLRTTFAFLPEDGFCFVNNKNPNEEYRVDFYDPKEWIKYRFSPCIGPPAIPVSSIFDNWGLGELSPKRSSTTGFGRALLEDLSGSLPSLPSLPLPIRNRPSSATFPQTSTASAEAASTAARHLDENASTLQPALPLSPASPSPSSSGAGDASAWQATDPEQARNMEYLVRTLSKTKQFRAELAHRPEHTAANVYPPLAVIYGKGIPTVYAARVSSREAIATTVAYDDLVFRNGDGVVLSREALLPPGYHYVRDGYVSTDRGHVGMLGDLNAVGTALAALIRGRQKGIGLGTKAAVASPTANTHTPAPTPAKIQTATGPASENLAATTAAPIASA